jgi:serine/threonine protein kinase/Tol biopolymer transport system component
MTLASGTRLGPYEILAPIGAGGMGEVYRARDTRLERTVAVKVLSDQLSKSEEVRQRFEREAKTISQLSHPHICALYDVGREGQTEYLVMEYLEGETLADRLSKGPLPLEQTLRYGIEMSDALDKAHRQGIVHRDLKPGNVMLTKSGVKLLDFGLAKAIAPAAPQSGLTAFPTIAGGQNLTEAGTILGTFQYMAPEQLEGKEADARTDIFAFGCVLYEMTTAKKAFAGSSQASLISAIMQNDPPPISSVSPMTPPALDRVVRICLAKDPDDRWQSAHDIAGELKWIAESSPSGVPAPVAVIARRRNRERLAWLAFAVASLAAIGLAVSFLRRPSAPPPVIRFEILPSENAPYAAGDRDLSPAVSPDGRLLAFVGEDSRRKAFVWVRPLDGIVARPLPGTEGADYPFWSPDSRSIGFFSDSRLKKIDAAGGPVQVVCEASSGRGGTWSREGVILFSPSATSPIYRVAASGGAPAAVLGLDAAHGEDGQRWPHFLPDGRHFLYFSYLGANPESRNQNGGIRVGSLDFRETKAVVPQASNPVYIEPGVLLFFRDGNVLAQPFDLKALKTAGDPVPVAENVAHVEAKKLAFFSASSAGVLAYAREAAFQSRLLWLDRQGRQIGSVGEPGDYSDPRLSSDGRRLVLTAVDVAAAHGSIWIYDLSRGARTLFSQAASADFSPVWSPDGSRIAFASERGGAPRLFLRAAGGGAEQSLLKTTDAEIPTDWSRDGRFLAYAAPNAATGWDVWILPLEGDRKPYPFMQTKADEGTATFSPDGKWIAYDSKESGKSDVYAAPFPGPGERIPISTAGGRDPKWRGDGKEIFYTAEDGKMMAVPIKAGTALEPGVPIALFETRTRNKGGWRYDVTPDGQRFLVITKVQEQEALPMTVVVNWTARLKR